MDIDRVKKVSRSVPKARYPGPNQQPETVEDRRTREQQQANSNYSKTVLGALKKFRSQQEEE